MRIFLLIQLVVLLAISGCANTRSSSFKEMSSAYREVVEQYSTDNILLNIVRASNNMPLSFLDIPSVVGSGSMTVSAGIGTDVYSKAPASVGGFFSAANTATDSSNTSGSLGMSINNGFTFTQSSLDNSSFMLAFLKEMPIEYVDYKGTERLRPRTVEYSLLIDKIELVSPDGEKVLRFVNDPMAPHYQKFQEALLLLIEVGLRAESRTQSTPITPPMSQAEYLAYSRGMNNALIDNIVKGSIEVVKKSKGSSISYQLFKNTPYSVMCVNKHEAKRLYDNFFHEASYCETSAVDDVSEMNYSSVSNMYKERSRDLKDMKINIKLRSVGNVFDYLGSVMLVQQKTPPKDVLIYPSRNLLQSYYDAYKEPTPLLKVYKNNSSINPVASVKYRGDIYAISDDDDSYSKIVIEYLSILLTMAKVPGSIPASPAVLVR
ncbi:hypothetical protein [Polynucleobacter sp. MWH-UH23A]|uniref:hypothetical protein n=1 Tax=Polynucleobacter sp. MWH-UH23A TaxID=1855613 RepID=UPI0033651A5C